jgi:hypothetical protein
LGRVGVRLDLEGNPVAEVLLARLRNRAAGKEEP